MVSQLGGGGGAEQVVHFQLLPLHVPLLGPEATPARQVPVDEHHPHPAVARHEPQLELLAHGSGGGPEQELAVHFQSEPLHPPLVGPLALPARQLLVFAHQPQYGRRSVSRTQESQFEFDPQSFIIGVAAHSEESHFQSSPLQLPPSGPLSPPRTHELVFAHHPQTKELSRAHEEQSLLLPQVSGAAPHDALLPNSQSEAQLAVVGPRGSPSRHEFELPHQPQSPPAVATHEPQLVAEQVSVRGPQVPPEQTSAPWHEPLQHDCPSAPQLSATSQLPSVHTRVPSQGASRRQHASFSPPQASHMPREHSNPSRH